MVDEGSLIATAFSGCSCWFEIMQYHQPLKSRMDRLIKSMSRIIIIMGNNDAAHHGETRIVMPSKPGSTPSGNSPFNV